MSASRALAALSVLALLTAGCTGDSEEPGEASSTSPSPTETATPPQKTEADRPAPEPSKKGGPLQFRPVVVSVPEGGEVPETDAAPPEMLTQLDEHDCGSDPAPAKPAEVTIACDTSGTRYLLDPAVAVGGVSNAEAYEFGDQWAIGVFLGQPAVQKLTKFDRTAKNGAELALQLGGVVLDAGAVADYTDRGRFAVRAAFDKETATAVAKRLERG